MAWLTGWSYRKLKTIGAADSSISDFTVTGGATPLKLHTGSGTDDADDLYFDSKCKDYFDDIRVTASDGITELPFYIRDCIDTYGELCVLTDVNDSSRDIYIYYGNSEAFKASDIGAAFPQGSEDSSKRIVISTSATYNAWPTITKLSNGTLFCVWSDGTSHTNNDQDLYWSKSTDGGRTWSAPSLFYSDDNYQVGGGAVSEVQINSVNTILVSFQVANTADFYDTNRKVKIIGSQDEGTSWGSDSDFDDGNAVTIAGTGSGEDARGVRCKPIMMSNGYLAVATYNHYSDHGHVFFNYCADPVNAFSTWAEVAVGTDNTNETDEPVLIEIKDSGSYNGDLYILTRCDGGDYNPREIYSDDYGVHWGSNVDRDDNTFAASGLTADQGDAPDIGRAADGTLLAGWSYKAGDNDGEVRMVKASTEDASQADPIVWDMANYALVWRERTSTSSNYAYMSFCPLDATASNQIAAVVYRGSSSNCFIGFSYVPWGDFHGSYLSTTNTKIRTHNTYLAFECDAATSGLAEKLIAPTSTDFWIEYAFKNKGGENFAVYGCDGSISHRLFAVMHPWGPDQNDAYYMLSDAWATIAADSFADDTRYNFCIRIDEDNSKQYVYYYDSSWSLVASQTNKAYAYGSPTELDRLLVGDTSSVYDTDWAIIYWLSIRPYAATEPAWGVTGAQEIMGSASLSGNGTLSAIAQNLCYATVSLSGAGTLGAIGHTVLIGKATLSGIGTLAAIGRGTVTAEATLGGAGTLSAVSRKILTGQATISGVGTLVSIARVRYSGAGTLSGIGTVTAIGQRIISSQASLSGTGTLAATGQASFVAKATLAGEGALTANGVLIGLLKATFTGEGFLSGYGYIGGLLLASATLSGEGTLLAQAVGIFISQATLTGVGTLDGIGRTTACALATLSGTGSLAAVAAKIATGIASFLGTGSLSVSITPVIIGKATLSGVGTLSTCAICLFAARATLTGMGLLSVTEASSLMRKVYTIVAITSQYRLIKSATSQKRVIKTVLSGG